MTAGLEGDGLRALVREALADLLPGLGGTTPGGGAVPIGGGGPTHVSAETFRVPPAPPAGDPIDVPGGRLDTVQLRTDADLAEFVGRLLHLFDNPKTRQDLLAGRVRFRLGGPSVPGSVQPVHRVERGAVTEAAVKEAARAGAKLVLGPDAVLTPLARDRARSAGVIVSKEQP